MPLIGKHIFQCPTYLRFKREFSFRAIVEIAEPASGCPATICMYKQFDPVTKFSLHGPVQGVYLLVGLFDMKIPWNSQMTIDVQDTAVFDDPEIVDIHPCSASPFVQMINQLDQEGFICFIHDPGD